MWPPPNLARCFSERQRTHNCARRRGFILSKEPATQGRLFARSLVHKGSKLTISGRPLICGLESLDFLGRSEPAV